MGGLEIAPPVGCGLNVKNSFLYLAQQLNMVPAWKFVYKKLSESGYLMGCELRF